jgi:hypothetical protein
MREAFPACGHQASSHPRVCREYELEFLNANGLQNILPYFQLHFAGHSVEADYWSGAFGCLVGGSCRPSKREGEGPKTNVCGDRQWAPH